jgi:NACHT domain
MGFAEFTIGIITNLLSSVIYDVTKSQLDPFKRRKIQRKIEDAIDEVVKPLLPFLENEHISEDKQRRLIETCAEEIRPLMTEPEKLFRGSLDGQKIFDNLYQDNSLPEVVVEDGLKDVYTILFPRIATIICKIPATVKDWESEAWSENFRRLDDLANDLGTLFQKVDELATSADRNADALLTKVRQAVSQKIGLELDITGLRGNKPTAGKFDDFFVHPLIEEAIRTEEEAKKRSIRVLENGNDSYKQLTLAKRRSIVIGQPGMGKSIEAKWLQRKALSSSWDGLCVRIELRRFSATDNLLSLHDLIRDTAGQHLAEELTIDRISQWVNNTKVIFILDGFDEIRPSDRDRIYEWICDLSIAAPSCPILVTSRPLTTDHLDRFDRHWLHWNICPFDRERIIDYIQRWYEHTPLLEDGNREIDPLELADAWAQDPTLAPLTGNPLLLSTLLMVHHLDGKLPSGRSELYRRYVDGMLGLWDDRRKVVTSLQISLEQKHQLLRGFALQMFLQQQDQIDETAALELMHRLLDGLNIRESEEDVLAGLRERSSLIIGPGIYSFVHKSVLEFLVAECVVQGDQKNESGCRIDRLTLFEHRNDDRWNTVIFLWSGLAPVSDVESFIQQCIEVEIWDLAYGILSDQYERFSKEVRRNFIMKILLDNPNLEKYRHNVGFSRLYKKEDGNDFEFSTFLDFEFPTFRLRGVASDRIIFDRLLKLMIRNEDLIWSDARYVNDSTLTYLWINHAIHMIDVEQWKICINECCLDKLEYNYGMTLVLSEVCRQGICSENRAVVQKIVTAFQEVQPNLNTLLSIAIICGCIESIVLTETKIDPLRLQLDEAKFSNILSEFKILNFLAEIRDLTTWEDCKNAQDVLIGTNQWIYNYYHREETKTYDLLADFNNNLKQLMGQGLLLYDDVSIKAIDFVDHLIECREKLAQSVIN